MPIPNQDGPCQPCVHRHTDISRKCSKKNCEKPAILKGELRFATELASFCRETPTFLLGHVSCPIKPAQTDGGSRHSPSILTRFLMRFREAPVGTMQRSQ